MYLEHTPIPEWNTDVSTASYYIRKELYFNSAILHGYGHGVKCQKPKPRKVEENDAKSAKKILPFLCHFRPCCPFQALFRPFSGPFQASFTSDP